MLNFHDEFTIFDGKIKLSESRKSTIRKSRDAVREKIRKYFSETLGISSPKFWPQGSFVINTALNPLPDEEVDADDGIYLTSIKGSKETWPNPSDIHKYIMDALIEHTHDRSESKTSCVRVLYRNFYHLDIPVYIIDEDTAFLGQTSNDEWIESDSKAFKEWFYSKRENLQNTRVIRYLKAWRDKTNSPFTSIELTIEGINSFSGNTGNDHLALLDTVDNIYRKVSSFRSIFKPVSPFENLWGLKTKEEIDSKIEYLRILSDDIRSALNANSNSKASTIFREIFGDRFPIKNDRENKVSEEILTGAKPWGIA